MKNCKKNSPISHFNHRGTPWILSFQTCIILSCSTLPTVEHKVYHFPNDAYLESPRKADQVMGVVQTKENYNSLLNPEWDEIKLCRNYYFKAVQDLVKIAKKRGADAVYEIRSVVFYLDGKKEEFETPECSDDGGEGQILVQGKAVKYSRQKTDKKKM